MLFSDNFDYQVNTAPTARQFCSRPSLSCICQPGLLPLAIFVQHVPHVSRGCGSPSNAVHTGMPQRRVLEADHA